MAGIVAYGAYIPWLRLERKMIAESWGIPGAPGEIAVANFDEDCLTMAVEAGRDCIRDDPSGVGGLFFASTSAPYRDKACSTLAATVLDIDQGAVTADFGGTLSAGMGALVAAVGAVNDGVATSVLVTAADCRVPEPKTADEQTLGDGAGAVLVGGENVIAEIKGTYTRYDEVLGSWRNADDRRLREGNARFHASKGYAPGMAAALKGASEKFGVTADDLSRVVYAAPDFRSHQGIAKMMKLKPEEGKVQDALFAFVGGCGCAQPLMMLAAALEQAKPKDLLLVAGAGDAYTVFLLEVTDAIASLPHRRAVSGHMASKKNMDSYARFLAYRKVLELEPAENISSSIQMWRDRKAVYPLYGKKCNSCETVYFPPKRVCPECRTYDDNVDIRLSRKGKLFNFIDDNLYPSGDPPTTLTISDLEGGGRIFLQMTDREVGSVEIDMDVELVFRKIHEGGGFNNYYWKTRPVR